jgi:hypothetical protein
MSAISLDSEKLEPAKSYSLARRLAYGPALIVALGAGSSGVLIAALILSSIFEI